MAALPALALGQSCSVKSACNGQETELVKLSSQTNAHASLSDAGYAYKICCPKSAFDSSECDQQSGVAMKLSTQTNAHASLNDKTGYPVNVCLSAAEGKYVECGASGTIPVASISSDTNGHIGGFNEYATKIYCSVLTGQKPQPHKKSFETCEIISAEIKPSCTQCKEGDRVSVEAKYKGDCPAKKSDRDKTNYIQIDAESADEFCRISAEEGMKGIQAKCTASGDGITSCTQEWTVPKVPALCQGRTAIAKAASINHGDFPSSGTAVDYADQIKGSITFAIMPTDIDLQVCYVESDNANYYARPGDTLTIFGSTTGESVQQRLECSYSAQPFQNICNEKSFEGIQLPDNEIKFDAGFVDSKYIRPKCTLNAPRTEGTYDVACRYAPKFPVLSSGNIVTYKLKVSRSYPSLQLIRPLNEPGGDWQNGPFEARVKVTNSAGATADEMPSMSCQFNVYDEATGNAENWQSKSGENSMICGDSIPIDIDAAGCREGGKCILRYKATDNDKTTRCSWAFGIDKTPPQFKILDFPDSRGDLTPMTLDVEVENDASGILFSYVTDTPYASSVNNRQMIYACLGLETNKETFKMIFSDGVYQIINQAFCTKNMTIYNPGEETQGYILSTGIGPIKYYFDIVEPIPADVGSMHNIRAVVRDNALNQNTYNRTFELCKMDNAEIKPVCDASGCRLEFDTDIKWKTSPNEDNLCPPKENVINTDSELKIYEISYPKLEVYGSEIPRG